ncbi:hypothetical protein QTP70_009081 [Hemibagrus guttatus]|uniref:Endonuclease/exonuclease/phosphatase domain-containing protein n=1 Tax=Hemibagrus guttatus TaxID=175788 RepID=A0AAE0RAQ7_9TELE|nr:hypothetical protein QTP70_009081 [Hemibagrus guttatus]
MEIVVDDRITQKTTSPPLHINGAEVERVNNIKFLGLHITKDLTWTINTTYLVNKAQQRLFFLRKLKKAKVPSQLLVNFYRSTTESILCHCITVWYTCCTTENRRDLAQIIKTAQKIVGTKLPNLEMVYASHLHKRASNIIKDPTHPGHRLLVPLPSGKGRELADMMERRKVDILCVQETRWKGSKARSIGAGFKLFYYGVDSKRNGVGVVLKEELVRNVLEVKRVSDRVMSLKLEIEGVMLNVVSGYAPQVGCELEEKERFWSELDEVMESIPTGERVVIGADFNGHVGEGNTGDEEVMGKFGVKERNLEGQMVVDFAKRMDMGVVNTYFQKREEHRVTYKSGGRRTQVDYILCRRGNLKEFSDCKVVVGESVAGQHRMVVCRMTLMVCKKKRSKIEIEKKTK